MTRFEAELKNGRFVCSECDKCKKLVWPPSDFCNTCFGNVNWRSVSTIAKLIEFSKKDNVVFCLAEFENTIRLMGTLEHESDRLLIGQEIKLIKCGYDEKEKFVFSSA